MRLRPGLCEFVGVDIFRPAFKFKLNFLLKAAWRENTNSELLFMIFLEKFQPKMSLYIIIKTC